MKKDMKDHLRSLPIPELQKRLQELETEKLKLEAHMRHNDGSSTLVRNYPKEKREGGYGANLRRLKKDIARVKTFLNTKLNQSKGGKL